MDISKHIDFFDPLLVEETIHIIGLGALGSNLAIQLTRLGFTTFILYDFDEVDDHNITNQAFIQSDMGAPKVDAIKRHMLDINPAATIIVEKTGWKEGTFLNDYVFMCVDSIELRNEIAIDMLIKPGIKFVTDMRIGLEEAQMYATDWTELKSVVRFRSTMTFKDDEVLVPVSACGTQLTVLPTIQMIVSLGVMNFINFIKNKEYNYQSIIDSIQGIATSYKN